MIKPKALCPFCLIIIFITIFNVDLTAGETKSSTNKPQKSDIDKAEAYITLAEQNLSLGLISETIDNYSKAIKLRPKEATPEASAPRPLLLF